MLEKRDCCELPERRVPGCPADLPNGREWVGSRPAAFAETPPNSGQAGFIRMQTVRFCRIDSWLPPALPAKF